MADTPFKRGDIVVYKHSHNGAPWLNGSVGVVEEVKNASNIYVNWFAPTDADKLARIFYHSGARPEHYDYNLEKVGHIGLPTG